MAILQKIKQQNDIYTVNTGYPERNSTPDPVSFDHIHMLLSAANVNGESLPEYPLEFAIIQDQTLLSRLSDKAKEFVNNEIRIRMPEIYKKFNSNIFYNAETLIVICTHEKRFFTITDCLLSAENMIRAAHSLGLESCIVGVAVPILNSAEWKTRLGISKDMNAAVPVAVGISKQDSHSKN